MESRKRMNGSTSGLTRLWVMVCVFLVSLTITESSAKRFDCRMFCKETGFHGMIGGCRCSFTLFTAKRAIRDPVDDLSKLPQIGSFGSSNPTETRKSHSLRNSPIKFTPGENREKTQELPPKFRYLKFVNLDPELGDTVALRPASEGYPENRLMFGDLKNKRREIEQDLDNGETADFLRMPY